VRFVAVVLVAASAASAGTRAGFTASVSPIGPALAKRMTGVSWHPGCPLPISALRLVRASYWGFDGRPHRGELVVDGSVAGPVVTALHRLHDARFPIRRMQLVDDYGGDDFRSIEADNTSAFNCRNATGSTHWSEHAYGRAIDVNPIENPYVDGGTTSHPASRPYLDRSRHRPGMAYDGGVLVETFRSVGWGWGGDWTGSVHDYQHFSANGR
jgi:hypothetical protein